MRSAWPAQIPTPAEAQRLTDDEQFEAFGFWTPARHTPCKRCDRRTVTDKHAECRRCAVKQATT